MTIELGQAGESYVPAKRLFRFRLALGVVAFTASVCWALNIPLVPVGNPGNPGRPSAGSPGQPELVRTCGAVDYIYSISVFEITLGQYTEFLNAVAATDTHGLYNPYLWGPWGYQIERDGSPGSYTYSVALDWVNRPVNHVSWGDAARFVNWLSNDQQRGAQDASTTEDGSYALAGAMTDAELLGVIRKPGARYVIPTEDEWYKAAYHKNDGPTGHYWEFPTGSNNVPSNLLVDPDPGSNANFVDAGRFTIGAPYERTEVGAFGNSESPYGTYDQGGNIREWNETIVLSSYRGIHGGSYMTGDINYGHTLGASVRQYLYPTWESSDVGFRVALVPEPATLAFLSLFVAAALVHRRTGRHR